MKSDMELALFELRSRMAGMRKAGVTTEDAVKRDKPSNGLIENTVMLLRGIVRTIQCHIDSGTQEEHRGDSPVLPWFVEHAGGIPSCPGVKTGRDRRTPSERRHGKKAVNRVRPVR